MKLKYRKDGTFRILQITDTHIGNRPYNAEDEKTFEFVKNVLQSTDADLIVHTGDVIWSEGVTDPDEIFEEFMELFNTVDVPVAITFGNHDAEETVSRSDLREIFGKTVKHQVEKTNQMIVDDREAYTVEVFDSVGKEVNNVLYVIDSGADAPLPIGIYEWNHPKQVQWFKDISETYKKGDQIKRNLVFQHIPVPEYWQAKDNIAAGVNLETNEQISAPHINTGLFANMLLNRETWGMFVGHDHENNFDGVHHGIHLVYGNVSGYNTYGDLSRGVRMIEMNANTDTVKTYIVDENAFTR